MYDSHMFFKFKFQQYIIFTRMLRNTFSVLVVNLLLTRSVTSQYFPPRPEGITVLKSKFHEDVTISYKEVR